MSKLKKGDLILKRTKRASNQNRKNILSTGWWEIAFWPFKKIQYGRQFLVAMTTKKCFFNGKQFWIVILGHLILKHRGFSFHIKFNKNKTFSLRWPYDLIVWLNKTQEKSYGGRWANFVDQRQNHDNYIFTLIKQNRSDRSFS